MEAVYNGKPVLMSDSILGGIELYGQAINYFQWDDMDDFKLQLKKLYSSPSEPTPLARGRIAQFTPKGVGEAINKRIKQLCA